MCSYTEVFPNPTLVCYVHSGIPTLTCTVSRPWQFFSTPTLSSRNMLSPPPSPPTLSCLSSLASLGTPTFTCPIPWTTITNHTARNPTPPRLGQPDVYIPHCPISHSLKIWAAPPSPLHCPVSPTLTPRTVPSPPPSPLHCPVSPTFTPALSLTLTPALSRLPHPHPSALSRLPHPHPRTVPSLPTLTPTLSRARPSHLTLRLPLL